MARSSGRRGKLAAAAPNAELRNLAMVAQRTTNAVVITDPAGRVVWVNQGFTRISGYSLAEVAGRTPGSVLQFEKTDPSIKDRIRQALASGRSFRGEVLNRAKDGREYWLDLDIQPLRDPAGTLTGFMAIETDITLAKQTEKALRESEHFLQSTLDALSAHIAILDETGVIIGVNAAWRRFAEQNGALDGSFGLGSNYLNVADCATNECSSEAAEVAQGIRAVISGRMPAFELEYPCHSPLEQRWFIVRVTRFKWSGPVRVVVAHEDVSKARVAEQKLSATTQRLALATETARMGVWEWDLADNSATWDARMFSMFGLEPTDRMTYELWRRCVHPDDIARVEETLAAVIQFKGQGYFEFRIARASDGRTRSILGSARATLDARGHVKSLVGINFDLTDRKQADAALEASEERWAFAFDGSGDGVWDWNLDDGSVLLSTRWKSMLGYADDEIGSKLSEWSDRVHPDDLPRALADVQAHLAGETPTYVNEHRMRCKDGSWKWILARGTVVRRDQEGNPLRIVGTHTDISERKRMQAESERSAALLAEANAALEEAQAVGRLGNWSHDLASGSLRCSRQLFRLVGRDQAPAAFRFVDFLAGFVPQDAARLEAAFASAALQGEPFTLVLKTLSDRGAARWLRVEGRARADDMGRVTALYGTAADLTPEIEREENLRLAQRQAEAASLSKSEFLANMSHEIRTPMTAIMGYTDLLAEDGDRALAPRSRLEYIDTIKRNGEHLLALINDILDISKIEAGKMTVERIDASPEQIVGEVLSLMQVKARSKGLVLAASAETPIPMTIKTDPVRLRQVLVNLVGNAIKFTELGCVNLRVSFLPGPEPSIRFDIADTGIGLAPEQIARLFGAFEQVDSSITRRFGGTGLGLRISRRLSQMLGGDISVVSELGKGSVFSATIAAGPAAPSVMRTAGALPVAASASDPLAPPPQAPAMTLSGLRVVLAEDGVDNQRLISLHLRKSGASVHIVDNGRRLIEFLSADGSIDGPLSSPPPVDLILSDMQMPEMDGYAAARLLRAKGCHLPIIALTAHTMSGDEENCLAAGCDAYASKPVDRARLVELCGRWAAKPDPDPAPARAA